MKVITLCGSMRFFNEMQEIAKELETKYGYCAITPIGGRNITVDKEAVENLAKALSESIHRTRPMLSPEIIKMCYLAQSNPGLNA